MAEISECETKFANNVASNARKHATFSLGKGLSGLHCGARENMTWSDASLS